MNNISITNSALEFQFIYTNRIIGFLGLILNSLGLFILLNRTLVHPMYSFTWARTFCNWLVCLFTCGYVPVLEFDQPGGYYQRAYGLYVFSLPLRISFFASSISDLLLILNRYFVITERRVWLLKISKLTNLAICYVFSVSLYVAPYFAFRLEAVGSNEEYAFKLTEFGHTTFFKGYTGGISLLETGLGVFTLGFFNVLSAIRFREKMIRKAHLLRNRTETRRAEIMFSKMVFILTSICFITRLLDAVAGAFVRSISAHAFDNWIYFLMDPNLRRCTRELFCRPTRQTTIVSCIYFFKLIVVKF